MKKTILIFLMGNLLISPSLLSMKKNNSLFKNDVAAGALMLGVGGLISLLYWLSNESDENVYANACKEYDTVLIEHVDFLHLFEKTLHVALPPSVHEKNNVISNITEQQLYTIATDLWNKNKSQSSLVTLLKNSANSLTCYQKKLTTSINALRTQLPPDDPLCIEFLKLMENIWHKINILILRLNFSFECLDHHKYYFILFEKEDTLRIGYQQELEILSQSPYDKNRQKAEIRYCITLKHKLNKYKYLAYLHTVEQDIKAIKGILNKLAYNYENRISWSQWLCENLEYIKELVLIDPEYTKEVQKYEREKIEKEIANKPHTQNEYAT